MKRLLVLAILALLVSAAARADDGGWTTVVTGLRLPRPLRDVPATITVISRDEIDRSPVPAADDVMRGDPSAATFRRSSSVASDPTAQGANLRGLGPSAVSRALVLLDGIPLNDPFGGWIYWRAIPRLAIDRIEIEPSGASALFGNFALGGVVQMFSRRVTGPSVEAELAGGSLGTGRAAARLADRFGAHGELGVEADGELFTTGGYAPIAADQRGAVDGRAPTSHASAGARAEWLRGSSLVRAAGRFFDEAYDAGTRFTDAHVRTATGAAAWLLARPEGSLTVDVFGGAQRFAQERARVAPDRSDASLASEQRVPSDDEGATIAWTSRPLHGGGVHTVLVGADALRVAGTSIDTLHPPMPGSSSLVGREAGGTQRFAGLFAQDAVTLDPHVDVSAAVRVDLWQDLAGRLVTTRADGSTMTTAFADRSAAQLDPRIGAIVRASDRVAVRASLYRSFRAPTLNELYRPFQVGTVLTDANPTLRAETSWGAEVGPELVLDTVVARATGFWNELDDPIDNVTLAMPLADGATRQRQNLGHARVRGVELEASWRPTQRWIANAAYTLVAPVVTAAPGLPDLVGKDLGQDPRHRAAASLTFDDDRIVRATGQVRLIGRAYEDDQNALPMDRYVVVDALIERRVAGRLAAFADAQNLFDARYLIGRAGVDTVGPPRVIVVGLRLTSER